jgi:predicted phage tail protein
MMQKIRKAIGKVGGVALLALLLLAVEAQAGVNLVVRWDASPTVGITGYKIFATTDPLDLPAGFDLVGSAGPTTLSFTNLNLTAGTWRFYVTAVNDQGMHSDPSNIVAYTVKQKPLPPNVRPVELFLTWNGPGKQPAIGVLEESATLEEWAAVGAWNVREGIAFYRVRLE